MTKKKKKEGEEDDNDGATKSITVPAVEKITSSQVASIDSKIMLKRSSEKNPSTTNERVISEVSEKTNYQAA